MDLRASEKQLLEQIKAQLSFVADISRAEGLLYSALYGQRTTVLAHYHPHSVAPAYLKNYIGARVKETDMPTVIKALSTAKKQRGKEGVFGDGAKVEIEVWPVFSPEASKRVIGAISIDTSLIEYERHRRRNRIFRNALLQLQYMLTIGALNNVEQLSPFGEYEGLMLVSPQGNIRYTSGVAANLYRRLGYLDDLIGRNLDKLQTKDNKLFRKALETGLSQEQETEDGGRNWIRKAVPLLPQPGLRRNLRQVFRPSKTGSPYAAVLMIVRDITDERRSEQEIRVKNAMIKEIHHRVKNNLQTISALLRLQSRRIENPEAKIALNDAISRILSVAVIHEFLSDRDSAAINMKDVCQRIITQTRAGIVLPEDNITIKVTGPSIWLPARQATACALVLNELLQNALEHGFDHQKSGTITINLADEGDKVVFSIQDDGQGLPDTFDSNDLSSLGLKIANTLITEDLQGKLEFANNNGTTVTITVPKDVFDAEEGWDE